jgi:hypothetical protein
MLQMADSSITAIDAEMREIKATYQAAVDERVKNIAAWVSGKIDLATYVASGLAMEAAGNENSAALLRVMANPNFKEWKMQMLNAKSAPVAA